MKKNDSLALLLNFYASALRALYGPLPAPGEATRKFLAQQAQEADARQLGDDDRDRSADSTEPCTTDRAAELATPDRVDRLGMTWVRLGDDSPLTARVCGNPECSCADLPGPVGTWWMAVTGPLAELVNNGRPLDGEPDEDEDQDHDEDEDQAPAYDPLRPFSGPWSPFGPVSTGRVSLRPAGVYGAPFRMPEGVFRPLTAWDLRLAGTGCDCPRCERTRAQLSDPTVGQEDTPTA